jgi:hypothetical protein
LIAWLTVGLIVFGLSLAGGLAFRSLAERAGRESAEKRAARRSLRAAQRALDALAKPIPDREGLARRWADRRRDAGLRDTRDPGDS